MTTTDAPVRVDHATDVTAPLPDSVKQCGFVTTHDYLRRADSVRGQYRPIRTTDFGSTLHELVVASLGETSISLPPEVWRVLIATVQQVLPTADVPMSQRMRDAAEVIESAMAVYGHPLDMAASPRWLRAEADRLEVDR